MIRHTHSQIGSVLLEAVVALGIIVIIMTAMAIVVTASLANATFIKNQNLANKYAQEGISIVRMMRDSDYSDFKSKYVDTTADPNKVCFNNNYDLSVDYCSYSAYPLNELDPVLGQGFHREITIQKGCGSSSDTDSTTFQVKVSVSWAGGDCSSSASERFCHKAELISCMSVNPNQQSL